MDIHHCLLCLGSNDDYIQRLAHARKALRLHFPDIRFSREMETEAIGGHFRSPFGNQLATFTTPLSAEEIRLHLKQMERDNGRLPEDKAHGIVKLDIDLLMYDDIILKPEDMEREFVQQLLEECRIN